MFGYYFELIPKLGMSPSLYLDGSGQFNISASTQDKLYEKVLEFFDASNSIPISLNVATSSNTTKS